MRDEAGSRGTAYETHPWEEEEGETGDGGGTQPAPMPPPSLPVHPQSKQSLVICGVGSGNGSSF